MVINMSFKQLDSSDTIRAYATEKTEKLKKYFNGKIHVTWTFSASKQDFIAHCHLVGNHMDYYGESEKPTLQESIDDSLEKIEKQLRKHKEIVKDHLHKH